MVCLLYETNEPKLIYASSPGLRFFFDLALHELTLDEQHVVQW